GPRAAGCGPGHSFGGPCHEFDSGLAGLRVLRCPLSSSFGLASCYEFSQSTSSTIRKVAERVAGFVARYASSVPRVGRLEAVRWDPSLATDGNISITSPGFEPLFYGAMALAGPSANLLLTSQLLLIGVLRTPGIGVGT